LPLFLGSIIALSLTGVMMPGPVTAVTVAKGSQRKEAGVLVALGHGIIEFPLIALLYFGFAQYLELVTVRIAVGAVGGVVLLWIALGMFNIKLESLSDKQETPRGSIFAGLATTAANPYFYVWWASIGAAILANAQNFGNAGIALFGITHWLCDAGWLFLLGWMVFKSKRLWTENVHRVVFGICAAVLLGFGGWFIYSSINLAVNG